MFSYIMLGTNDPQASYKFYAPLMRVLGHPLDGRSEKGAAWGTFKDNHTTGLCVGMPFDNLPATRGNGVMVALNAVSVDMVQELYRLAIENGGEDEGPPDYRPHYGADFYSA
ncbi:TPA: VOC family protein, partial [Klebsiella pneumoniae]|nr:VOC family protein [Klebsiella pneumoniae]HCT8187319.1 VOC family protein [Klebsiella pneumoniae]